MKLIEFCTGLLDSLQQFDTAILPLGLYASDELVAGKKVRQRYQEWQGAIFPYLASLGCPATGFAAPSHDVSSSSFKVPDIGTVGLFVIKFSDIKVRKYGSGYQVDIHEDRADRWAQADLSGHISRLWKPLRETDEILQARIVLLIGFDKSQRPLERELSDLEQSLQWEQKEVQYLTRIWPDKAGRGFNIRLSTWASAMEENT